MRQKDYGSADLVEGKVYRILLVEDHTALRQALALMLNREPEFVVVGEAGTLAGAREMLGGADIAIVDLGLPDGNGVELIRELRGTGGAGEGSGCVALVLTASLDRMEVARAVEAGAAGVIHKAAPVAEIVDALRRLCADEPLLSPAQIVDLLGFAVRRRERDAAARSVAESLTSREREVLQALARGLSNGEIARQLGIAVETERNYMTNILTKLRVKSRLQAVVFAMRHGLVDVEPTPPDEG